MGEKLTFSDLEKGCNYSTTFNKNFTSSKTALNVSKTHCMKHLLSRHFFYCICEQNIFMHNYVQLLPFMYL